jgi:hypothetical protein
MFASWERTNSCQPPPSALWSRTTGERLVSVCGDEVQRCARPLPTTTTLLMQVVDVEVMGFG